jgi:FtsH-binding integral membrane protein
VAIYAGNFNFLFWGAQFSYESLALPLLLLAMMALAEREAAPKEALRTWGAPVVLAMLAIVVTHHLTSYAMAGLLVALSLAYWYVRRSWNPPNPWPLAIFGILLAAFWLFVVASATVGYLSPVLSDAFNAIGNTIGGSDEPRALFQGGGSSVAPTPLAARAVALAAVVTLLAGLPFGLKVLWHRYMKEPLALLFGIAAVAFFATLVLRLAPAAWETANRASEFLFVGLAFVLACACVEALRRWPRDRRTKPLIAAAIALVLVGGAISGWPWDSQLARPLRASAAAGTISSPPLSLAQWAEGLPGGRFAASTADAGLLLDPGGKMALTGSSPDIEDVLEEEGLADWMVPMLRRNGIRYIAVDRRQVGSDSLRGYYFSRRDRDEELLPESIVSKFDEVPGISRVYTNGPITVFDLGARR